MQLKLLKKKEFEELIPQFIELYKLCFSGKVNEKYFKWRYMENPCEDILVAVAMDENKVVAYYAVSPSRIRYDGEVLKSAISINTMTHPDYRGQGLFVKLAKLLFNEMEELNYSFVYGFPNYISHRVFNEKLGWSDIYEIPTLMLDLSNETTLNLEECREDNYFELTYDSLDCGKIGIVKDIEYLRWRYSRNPLNDYKNYVIYDEDRVNDNLILKEYEDMINIIELNCRDVSSLEKLINSAIMYAKRKGKRKISAWIPINSINHSYMEKRGFRNTAPITYFSGRVLDKKLKESDLLNYIMWTVHAGDDNVY